MKIILALLSILIFCATFFGGIYFFHQDIVANTPNTMIFSGVNGVIGTLVFFAIRNVAKSN